MGNEGNKIGLYDCEKWTGNDDRIRMSCEIRREKSKNL